jgi:hypothetical protein
MENFPNLTYKIDSKSFEIFRKWVDEVKKVNSTFVPLIESEEEIIISVKKHILKCLKTISKKKDKRDLTDWCIGFLKGYLSSTLSTSWNWKYYKKPFKYKKALWLKSIILTLDADDEFARKVNRLYILLFENNFALENATDFSKIEINENEAQGHQILADLSYQENRDTFKTALIDVMYESLLEKEEEEIEFPEIENFFSYKEIEEIILKNPYKN